MKDIITLAPICLFVYSRLNETKLTVESLQKNILSDQSQLFIFSDGYKNENDKEKVILVREYIKQINGFRKVTIFENEENSGLANSIISGITRIINEYNKVIVLEDDLILSSNFLSYMNQTLNHYENRNKIISVSGFSFPIKYSKDYKYDVAFSNRASSWGWGTWKDRWDKIDWETKDYSSFKYNLIQHFMFNKGGSDLSRMLKRQINGKIDSWAIRFVYHQFKNKYYDVIPIRSKIINNGFSSESTNTKFKSERYDAKLDFSNQLDFKFPEAEIVDKIILRQKRKHFSYFVRFKDKYHQLLWKIRK